MRQSTKLMGNTAPGGTPILGLATNKVLYPNCQQTVKPLKAAKPYYYARVKPVGQIKKAGMLWISVWKSKVTFELMRLKWIVEPILSGSYIYRNSHIEHDLH